MKFTVSEFTKDLNTFCEKHNCEWDFNTDKQTYEIKYRNFGE